MKATWLNWRKVLVDTQGLGIGAKAVGMYLATFMNDDHDMAWPSLSRICYELEISKPTAIKHLDTLERVGLLTREKRFGATTLYHARVPDELETVVKNLASSKESLPSSSKETLPDMVKNLYPNNQYNNQKTYICSPEQDFDFGGFWTAYPRKVGKAPSGKLWEKLPAADRAAVMADLASRQWPDDPRYVPHPRTYLHQRRWEDEASTRVAAVFGEDM